MVSTSPPRTMLPLVRVSPPRLTESVPLAGLRKFRVYAKVAKTLDCASEIVIAWVLSAMSRATPSTTTVSIT